MIRVIWGLHCPWSPNFLYFLDTLIEYNQFLIEYLLLVVTAAAGGGAGVVPIPAHFLKHVLPQSARRDGLVPAQVSHLRPHLEQVHCNTHALVKCSYRGNFAGNENSKAKDSLNVGRKACKEDKLKMFQVRIQAVQETCFPSTIKQDLRKKVDQQPILKKGWSISIVNSLGTISSGTQYTRRKK